MPESRAPADSEEDWCRPHREPQTCSKADMTSRWGRACRFAISQWRPPLFESGPPLQAPQESHVLPSCCPYWTWTPPCFPPSCCRQPHLPQAAFPLCDGRVSCVAQWSVPALRRWALGGRRGKDWFWVLSVPPPAPSQGGSQLSWNKSWKPRPRMRKDTKKRHKRETDPRGRLQVRVARVLRAAYDRRKDAGVRRRWSCFPFTFHSAGYGTPGSQHTLGKRSTRSVMHILELFVDLEWPLGEEYQRRKGMRCQDHN